MTPRTIPQSCFTNKTDLEDEVITLLLFSLQENIRMQAAETDIFVRIILNLLLLIKREKNQTIGKLRFQISPNSHSGCHTARWSDITAQKCYNNKCQNASRLWTQGWQNQTHVSDQPGSNTEKPKDKVEFKTRGHRNNYSKFKDDSSVTGHPTWHSGHCYHSLDSKKSSRYGRNGVSSAVCSLPGDDHWTTVAMAWNWTWFI